MREILPQRSEDTAVHRPALPGDVAGGIGQQEGGDFGDFVRTAGAALRNGFGQQVERAGWEAIEHRRFDQAGDDTIAATARDRPRTACFEAT